MISYPLQFTYRAEAVMGTQTLWTTQTAEGRSAPCAVPPEFEGPGNGYSPEDFFGLSLLNCFVATFKVIAEKSKVPFKALTTLGSLTVDRDERGRPYMKTFGIEAHVSPGPDGESARIRRVFDKTTESCIVANSVKTQVIFTLILIDASD